MNVSGNYEKYHGKFEIMLNRERERKKEEKKYCNLRLSYVIELSFPIKCIFLSYDYSKIKILYISIN